MCNFIYSSLTDPALFWPALEAIATFAAALVIFWQLRQLHREAVAHRFDGFKYAMELLSSSEFTDQVGKFHTFLEQGDPSQFKQALPPLVHWTLRTLEIVNRLITDKYLDEEFLFRIEGLRLASLAEKIKMVEEGDNMPHIEEQIRLYPNGRDLLHRAEKWKNQIQTSRL
jgi:hypothetical protein